MSKLARRLRLLPAAHPIRRLGRLLPHEFQILRGRQRRVIGQRRRGQPIGLGEGAILEPFRRPFHHIIEDRRTRGLHGDDGLHQLRPGVGDEPAEGSRLRMGEEDRRADPVEQRRACIAIELLLAGKAFETGIVLCDELIEDGIALHARARPLGVQLRLRPELVEFRRSELALHPAHGLARLLARLAQMGRAGARGLVDHIDRVARPQEKLPPAFAPIGGAGVVEAALSTARKHHQRQGLGALRGDLELHIHLAGEEAPVGMVLIMAADEEIALLGDADRVSHVSCPRSYLTGRTLPRHGAA